MRHVLCWAIVFHFAAVALADVPPPPPEPGFKRAPLEFVLRLAEELPDYKFFPYSRLTFRGGQESVGIELKLGTTHGVNVSGSSSASVETGIVAVPTSVMDELGSTDNLAKLLSRDNDKGLPPNVATYETEGESVELPDSDPRGKVERVVLISRDAKAGVVFRETEAPTPAVTNPARSTEAPQTRSGSPMGMVITGVAAGLALTMAGLWILRRK